MAYFTRLGDNGVTIDLTGRKIPKNSAEINLIGTIDELNAHMGLIKAMLSHTDAWQFTWKKSCVFLERTQKNLMKLMSHISDPTNEKYFFNENDTLNIENEIDTLGKNIPNLTSLVIPGVNIIEAQIQIARTIARRVERYFFAAKKDHALNSEAGNFLNRLSDYLFVLSQQESLVNVNFINQITGV